MSLEGFIGADSCAPYRAAFHQIVYNTTQLCRVSFKMKMVSSWTCHITVRSSHQNGAENQL